MSAIAGLLVLLATLADAAKPPVVFEAHDRVVMASEFPALMAADRIVVTKCMVLLPTHIVVTGKAATFEDCTFVMLPDLPPPFIHVDNSGRQRFVRCKFFCLPARRAAEALQPHFDSRESA